METGKFIVFEGIDKSGKTTLSKQLCEELRDRNVPVRFFSCPNRSTKVGQLLDQYLKDPNDPLEPHALHLLFSANRWEMAPAIRDLLRRGISVVCDRYYYSGVAYSLARGDIDSIPWAIQTDVGLPEPDRVYFLDISADQVKGRKGYGDEIYEKVDFQSDVRRTFLELYSSRNNWKHLHISPDQTPRDILSEILEDLCMEPCVHPVK
mmetsp:Transcript_15681/g.39835  ORF Transcript_15681/g.39835 Transcript_15681/m.39835 type:complete len:207 (-) Transcript_15681:4331-4951(-)